MDNLPVSYEALVRMMPPRAIEDDTRCEETIAVIDRLMVSGELTGELTRDQAAYMEALVQLVQAYESKRYPILTRNARVRGTESCSHCGGRGYDCDIHTSCAACDGVGTQCADCHFPLPDCECGADDEGTP